MAFVSHDLRHPVLQKIVALGNEDSLLQSYLPASIISTVDPAVSSVYGSKYSGLSLAIGGQPIRIESDWLRIWLFNFHVIDSAVIPASQLSHVFALHQKYVAMYGLCSDDCDFAYGASESSLVSFNRYIWTAPDDFLKYLKNFYPNAATGYVGQCEQQIP